MAGIGLAVKSYGSYTVLFINSNKCWCRTVSIPSWCRELTCIDIYFEFEFEFCLISSFVWALTRQFLVDLYVWHSYQYPDITFKAFPAIHLYRCSFSNTECWGTVTTKDVELSLCTGKTCLQHILQCFSHKMYEPLRFSFDNGKLETGEYLLNINIQQKPTSVPQNPL